MVFFLGSRRARHSRVGTDVSIRKRNKTGGRLFCFGSRAVGIYSIWPGAFSIEDFCSCLSYILFVAAGR